MTDRTNRGDMPAFDALPLIEKLGLRHAWGVFGKGDRLGTVNHLGPEQILRAVSLVQRGDVHSLDLPLDQPDPPLFGREPYAHHIFSVTRNEWDDRLDNFHPQASSQWDALAHVRCREFGFYGGEVADPETGGSLGVDAYADHGLVGRGVLIDVDRFLAERGEPLGFEPRSITADEIAAAAADQGTTIDRGDLLCVRTGWVGRYLELDRRHREDMAVGPRWPGLRPDEEMARRLWDWGVAAIICDNPAVEVSEADPSVGSLHRRILPLLGMAMGELFVLDELAQACAADGRWEFLFVGVPIKVPGGLGSPANSVAIR